MKPRFRATIVYRTDAGPRTETHDLCEIYDLGDVVEGGPHWDTIEVIRVNHITDPTLTVEQAEKL